MSKNPLRIFAVFAALSVCGTLHAVPYLFSANLDGPSESPANASPGNGTVLVSFDPDAHVMSVQASWSDLLGLVTAAHIHVINGPGDANVADTVGPVATTTPTFPGFPSGVTSGSYNQTFDMTLAGSYRAGFITDSGGTTAQAEAELFAAIAEGRAYFNIHTNLYGGGEIRGFLARVPDGGATAALLMISLLSLFGLRRWLVRAGV